MKKLLIIPIAASVLFSFKSLPQPESKVSTTQMIQSSDVNFEALAQRISQNADFIEFIRIGQLFSLPQNSLTPAQRAELQRLPDLVQRYRSAFPVLNTLTPAENNIVLRRARDIVRGI